MILAAFIDLGLIPQDEVIEVLECAGNVMADTEVKIGELQLGKQKVVLLKVKCDESENICGKKLVGCLERAIELVELSEEAKIFARITTSTILEAEMMVHDTTLDDLHLHETGSPDTLVDIVGISYFYDKLKLFKENIFCTPISVGEGTVKIAHGIVPVPAPATAKILEGMKFQTGPVHGELATPTGAAILKNLVSEFIVEDIKDFKIEPERVGCSTGTRKFGEGFDSIFKVIFGK
jgi:uncharacterized protein (DUF111 family)